LSHVKYTLQLALICSSRIQSREKMFKRPCYTTCI